MALILFSGNKIKQAPKTPEIAPEAPTTGIVLFEVAKENKIRELRPERKYKIKNFILPIFASTLSPKIHKNQRLPIKCEKLAWMKREDKKV